MPATASVAVRARGRKHLTRLETVFDAYRAPIYLITCCVRNRRPVLATQVPTRILAEALASAPEVYGWIVGRYVIMPDHLHFFAAPQRDDAKTLSAFIGTWKRWTKRRLRQQLLPDFDWQAEFFDHLLRSGESYGQKWDYVRANPVRANLVARPEDWPFQGELNVLEW
jgi:REP element-mobilizing transposase RayT